MITRFFFLLIISTIFNVDFAFGQERIKTEVINYLIKAGELKPNDDKDYIYIYNLLNIREPYNKNSKILQFGIDSPHLKTYLLLNDDKISQFINLEDLDEDLLTEIKFLKKHKIPSNEIVKYLEATIWVYQKNSKACPWQKVIE